MSASFPRISASAVSVQPTDRMLVSIPQAASALGLGRTRLYELLDAGEIETVKIGKRRLIVWASLVGYVENLRSKP